MLSRWPSEAFLNQRMAFFGDLFCLALYLTQQLLLAIVYLAVRKDQIAQPSRLSGVEGSFGEHMLLDRVEEKSLEATIDAILRVCIEQGQTQPLVD